MELPSHVRLLERGSDVEVTMKPGSCHEAPERSRATFRRSICSRGAVTTIPGEMSLRRPRSVFVGSELRALERGPHLQRSVFQVDAHPDDQGVDVLLRHVPHLVDG